MTEDLIVQLHTGDNGATLTLVNKFDPLLKKYAYKLYNDDAYNDLLFDFIELLNKIRLDCIRGTSEGIIHCFLLMYIYLSETAISKD